MAVNVRRVRFVACLAMCVLPAVPVARAGSIANGPRLPKYVAAVTPRIVEYAAVVKRLDGILSETPMVNVDPKVDKLRAVASRFDQLAARWGPIQAPKGMKLRHRGMGRVFELHAQGWRTYADGLFTRHPEELHDAIVKLGAMLRSAAYLQKRWAAALQGALIRAGVTVPRWLRGMASEPSAGRVFVQS